MISEEAYEREERRHNEQAHAFAEFPGECVVCEQQSEECGE